MIKKRTIWIVISCLLLQFSWVVFSDEPELDTTCFWQRFGLDITKPYDLFLFSETEQKLKWYAHDSAYFLTMSIAFFSLRDYSRTLLILSNTLSVYYLFRLLEYWTFQFHVGLEAITAGLIIFSLFIHRRG